MGRLRLPVAVVVAVAAAAAATFLLRPRGVIEPVPVEAQQYFTASQLDRAEDFRSVQRLLGLAGLGIGIGTLALLAWRQPRSLIARLERRPLLGGAAAGAAISLVLVVTGLPINAWMRARALDVGLATQSWPDWAVDVVKAAGIGAVTAAVGGLVAMALVRRFPRRWWAPAALLVLVYGVVTIWLYPIVIDPVFNRFDRLPQGKLRSEVLELADRAGVDVGQVYRVDASRRTSAANAYVIGLGHSKRVVLYDNLIDDFSPGEVRTVVAHELGHQKHDDLLRGLAWLAIVAPAGTFLVQAVAERVRPRGRLGTPAALPAIALSIAVVSLGLGCASNVLSRKVEASADSFALRLTRDPEDFIGFQRRISVQNVGDPDPPGWYQALFGTHPTTLERIGAGVAFESK
ncbi:MAG TPA: M48 family metallopeptidase [Thermoleophilaceae bacterium]|nr:M48 family metallopeptidase [Thermoleophilaceae bacterium]